MTTIPHTYREAYRLLDEQFTDEERRALAELVDWSDLHYDLGLWIRNHWIYSHEREFLCDEPRDPDHGPLMKCFLTPDDASDELLARYRRHLRRMY